MGRKLLTYCGGIEVLSDENGFALCDENGNGFLSLMGRNQRFLAASDFYALGDEESNALVDENDNALCALQPSKLLCFNTNDGV